MLEMLENIFIILAVCFFIWRIRNFLKNLTSFNDAVANELIAIRLDLASLKVTQTRNENEIRITPELDQMISKSVPHRFISMWSIAHQYDSSYLCTTYQTPSNEKGYIIIPLDHKHEDIIQPGAEKINIDAIGLKWLNTTRKTHKFTKGNVVQMYLWEPDFGEGKVFARIVSITQTGVVVDGYPVCSLIKLETFDDPVEKITREVEVPWGHFIPDKIK